MPRRRPNLLMLAVDSLRRDHCSMYGYHRRTTPHLDELARSGVLFENMFSPYVPTTPGYSGMLTGWDVINTQMVGLSPQGRVLDPDHPTLGEILRDHGYASACVGFGGDFYRGFDKYADYEAWVSWEDRPARKAENLNDKALPMLNEMAQSGQPWCLFLRHMDPHAPYVPPPPFDTMFYSGDPCDPALPDTMGPVRDFKPFRDFHLSWMPPGIRDINHVIAQYDGELAYMDACIARIFRHIQELGQWENTLVLFTSDHGETLADHGCYFDHHGTYEPTLMVPLVLHWPGRLPAGMRLTGIALLEDIVPTLVDVMGLEKAKKTRFDGNNLMRMVRGQVANYRSEFYISECTWMRKRGWRTPEWKLIEALEPDFHDKPPVELYNLVTDPLEEKNLAKKERTVVEHLRGRMLAWLDRRMKETGKPDPIMTYTIGVDKYIGSIATAKKLQQR
ncbi:MAG: sulfatase [Armatimonadota bacterium]|nr:MAG: sulfatase [Armatimonadota bacterium]